MGLATLCNGAYGGIAAVTVPQLLAGHGVPEPQIATITGIAFSTGIFSFLLAPILDVGLSRRTYAIALGVIQAIAGAVAMASLSNLAVLTAALFILMLGYYLFTPAIAGWFGPILPREDEPKLGGWLAVGAITGFGLMSAAAIVLVRALPGPVGIGVTCLIGLLPLLILGFVPQSAPRSGLRQSFGPLVGHLRHMVRDRHLLRLLVVFAAPAATFALTNTLGGLGRDYHASEAFVGLIGGVATSVGGVFGALVAPLLARRLPLLAIYLGIGALGALFTLSLLVVGRTPATYALACIGENVFQSAAFAAAYALALLSLGKDNPFASTQYAFLIAALVVPTTYMQFLDGWAYGPAGLAGSFWMDAGVSIVACAILAVVFGLFWRDTLRFESVSEHGER